MSATRLLSRCFVFMSVTAVPMAAQAQRPAVESSKAATDEGPAPKGPDALPTDDAARALWYRPSPGEGKPSSVVRYVPLAVVLQPQVLIGAGGGTMSTLLANVPISAAFGLTAGARFGATTNFVVGLDVFRYTGVEMALARMTGTGTISLVVSPAVGATGYVGGGVYGGDASLAPIGIRASLYQPLASLIELRAAGHVLFGTDDSRVATLGTAGALGLEIVVAPLFWKRKIVLEQEAPAARRQPAANDDDDDDDAGMKKKKKKKKSDDDEEESLGPTRPRPKTVAAVTWGGAQ